MMTWPSAARVSRARAARANRSSKLSAATAWCAAAATPITSMLSGVLTARESTNNPTGGLLVQASLPAIARVFGALIPLQPVAWHDEGLVCAPQLAGLEALAGRRCPLPTRPWPHAGTWPDSTAALVAGWYRRSDRHAPAPTGHRELVQVAGEGFGPAGHVTTEMCLTALDLLPPAAAVDVGCGSGLLAQAWARRWRLPVLAIDLDPTAIAQTRASVDAAGCGALIEARRIPVQALAADALADRIVFANLPRVAHELLRGRFASPPRAVVLSGLRPHEAPAVVGAYRRMGLRHVRAMRRGRFECHVLVGEGV